VIDNPSDPQAPNDGVKEWRVPYVATFTSVDYGYLVVRARTAEEAVKKAEDPDDFHPYDNIIWEETPEVVDSDIDLDTRRDPFVTPHTEQKGEKR
jgi:hypothetical protein